ncbi:MAG TPA: hypothetical protein DCP92_22495 [Nitrospiraceae bacterium]|jgi:TFIIF-interacting CTD phosphatase-like protein|nr:hypothetical protein [Nitrospiraceae bacterium]
MKSTVFITLIFLLMTSTIVVFAEDEPKIFSNSDLTKYGRGDSGPSYDKGKNVTLPEPKSNSDKQEWCRLGKDVDDAMYKAREMVKKYCDYSDELQSSRFWNKSTGGSDQQTNQAALKCTALKRKLEEVEMQKSDAEFRAYQAGVPPGWLRCQF